MVLERQGEERKDRRSVRGLFQEVWRTQRRKGFGTRSRRCEDRRRVIRCTSMRGDTRCHYLEGHSGWHYDGAWLEWLDDEERDLAYQRDPCKTRIRYESETVQCELPGDHRSAHKGAGLIWTDPSPIGSTPAKPTWPGIDYWLGGK